MSGRVTAEDYDSLLPILDKAIAAHGKAYLLVVITESGGWEGLYAAKADFDIGTQLYRQVEKAALIGDKKWQKWATTIMDHLTRRLTERFLDSAQLRGEKLAQPWRSTGQHL